MDILIKILQFTLSLSLLVIIHEFGHFIFARIFKTRVEKFYLFFNPWFSLFKYKKGDTEYGIGWIPLGGYVKISGMIDESMDTEQLKKPMEPYEFRAKPAWQRLLIMVGGVMMNIVLAILIYMGLSYTQGDTYLDNQQVKYGYAYNDLAHSLGFEDGDKIINIGGEPLGNINKLMNALVIDQAEYATVERNGQPLRIEIPENAIAQLLKSSDTETAFAEPRLPFVLGKVVAGEGAAKAGLQAGDTLISLNGEPMRYFDQYRKALTAHASETINLSLMRDSSGVTKLITLPVTVSEAGTIGVQLVPLKQLLTLNTRQYTLLQSIPAGFQRTGEELSSYAKRIKLIFSPKTEAYKSLGGMLTIGNIFPGEWNWVEFWSLTAFLSIVLAVMNILPIPALDGGHVLFLLVEVITRRRPSEKFLERAQMFGIILLFALLIFANGNDIYRLFIQ